MTSRKQTHNLTFGKHQHETRCGPPCYFKTGIFISWRLTFLTLQAMFSARCTHWHPPCLKIIHTAIHSSLSYLVFRAWALWGLVSVIF